MELEYLSALTLIETKEMFEKDLENRIKIRDNVFEIFSRTKQLYDNAFGDFEKIKNGNFLLKYESAHRIFKEKEEEFVVACSHVEKTKMMIKLLEQSIKTETKDSKGN